MTGPKLFNDLVVDRLIAFHLKLIDDDDIRSYILKKRNIAQRLELQVYLAEILDGRVTDDELTAMWDKANGDLTFHEHDGVRLFLTQIYGWLVEARES